MRSNILIAGGLLLFGAIVLATWKPVDLRPSNTSITESGIVTDMYQTNFKDLVLKLHGQAKSYYIDGALEGGLTLAELKEKVLYKPVIIQYPERWSPLKNRDEMRYISKLEYEGEVIYIDGK